MEKPYFQFTPWENIPAERRTRNEGEGVYNKKGSAREALPFRSGFS